MSLAYRGRIRTPWRGPKPGHPDLYRSDPWLTLSCRGVQKQFCRGYPQSSSNIVIDRSPAREDFLADAGDRGNRGDNDQTGNQRILEHLAAALIPEQSQQDSNAAPTHPRHSAILVPPLFRAFPSRPATRSSILRIGINSLSTLNLLLAVRENSDHALAQ